MIILVIYSPPMKACSAQYSAADSTHRFNLFPSFIIWAFYHAVNVDGKERLDNILAPFLPFDRNTIRNMLCVSESQEYVQYEDSVLCDELRFSHWVRRG